MLPAVGARFVPDVVCGVYLLHLAQGLGQGGIVPTPAVHALRQQRERRQPGTLQQVACAHDQRLRSSFLTFLASFFSFMVLAGSFLASFLLSCALLIIYSMPGRECRSHYDTAP